jgi:hypothetical protein
MIMLPLRPWCFVLPLAFLLTPASAEGKKPAKASPARTTDKVEFIIGPDYADAPELAAKSDVPQGTVHEFVMKSRQTLPAALEWLWEGYKAK